jgi:hypothetical protein
MDLRGFFYQPGIEGLETRIEFSTLKICLKSVVLLWVSILIMCRAIFAIV